MKPPVAKLQAFLREETAARLEEQAAKLLDPEVARVKIVEAAGRGQWSCRLQLPDGLNIATTMAAERLQQWAIGEGLRFEWQRRPVDLPDGRRGDVYEPEFSWEPTSHDSRKA